ncbi:gliding motility-associated C-terminal domain-containing protein [Rubrolithibacter danxiaensis]|uniref:gliding motility-associated C-terminal domain-containing protein n=1 Tax=Rubrolithibacter danxiaensis TaxID=3390805 RepID=UPI003BF9128A
MKAFFYEAFLLLILLPFYSVAQLEEGNLGDPVVNIDFGSATQGPAPITTTYSLWTTDQCPPDGNYKLVANTYGCFNDSWHTLLSDHTGNGYMMLVNAKEEPGVFFRQTVSNLCPNTTYEFAAWVMNVQKKYAPCPSQIPVNLTFNIKTANGEKEYTTGDITSTDNPEWKQYGLYFTTGNESEIELKIINNAPGGCGNDLALDDITFRPFGPVVTPSAKAADGNSTICEGLPAIISLDAQVTSGTYSYQWQINTNDTEGWKDIAGATSTPAVFPVSSPDKKGYKFRLSVSAAGNISSSACRIYSDSILVQVLEKPVVDAGPDTIFTVQGRPVKLEGKITGATNGRYTWYPATDSPATLSTTAQPLEDTEYTLTFLSDVGCNFVSSDKIFVKVYKDLQIPNTFTPNGDGINDNWNIVALNTYSNAWLTVYNRFGEIVYRSIGYSKPWDGNRNGQVLPSGTYYYTLDLKEGTLGIKKGWVLVLH